MACLMDGGQCIRDRCLNELYCMMDVEMALQICISELQDYFFSDEREFVIIKMCWHLISIPKLRHELVIVAELIA